MICSAAIPQVVIEVQLELYQSLYTVGVLEAHQKRWTFLSVKEHGDLAHS